MMGRGQCTGSFSRDLPGPPSGVISDLNYLWWLIIRNITNPTPARPFLLTDGSRAENKTAET
jgi:hypothetical protein